MDRAEVKKRLEDEKARLERLVSEVEGEHGETDEGEPRSELSTVDQHPADAGSDVFEREKDMAIVDGFQNQLAEIEKAFGRLDDDSYGRCEVCDKQIDDARLEAIPWTRYCVEHQAELDRAG